MKYLITILILSITQLSFCQDCNTMAANKPSTLTMGSNVYSNTFSTQKSATWNISKMKPHLAVAESWIKKILTGFTGAKLLYSNEYSMDPLDFTNLPEDAMTGSYAKEFHLTTGIKGYYGCKMRFFAYYCNGNSNDVLTEGESGSSVHINFNNVFASGIASDFGVTTIQGNPAFIISEIDHREGRIDFYQQRAEINGDETYASKHDFIFIRNSDKPLFIIVSRKQYLMQLLTDVEIYRTKQKGLINEIYSNKLKDFEREIKIKREYDKTYSANKEALERKQFEENNKSEITNKDIQKIDADINGTIEVINEYLKMPQEWLARSFSNFYPYDRYTAKGLKDYLDKLDVFRDSKEELTRTQVVVLNQAYFNKKLEVDIPQLISVHLAKSNYPHMLKVAKLIKQPGALAPLQAILNSGKTASPQNITPEITSTYTLKYLPKLTRLTPLVIPAGMPPSEITKVPDGNANASSSNFKFDLPAHSTKLNNLPLPLNAVSYKSYIEKLTLSIGNAVKPTIKKKADEYLVSKKITKSKNISNAALTAWLQNSPTASLYLYSKAVALNPSDALTVNNFSAFLIMGGLPEMSIPLLEYWNQQKPGEPTLLSNLGNAFYQLGEMDKAMNYLQQCVQVDTFNLTANKILCFMYLKKGNTKKAEEHGIKSLTKSYDKQVDAILHQLNKNTKSGEIMSRIPVKEFPMLKRIMLPEMPSNLDDMERFAIELDATKKSINMTIAAIDAKTPALTDDVSQLSMLASFKSGISSLRLKAQLIILDGMQTYQRESIKESDVYKYQLKRLTVTFATTTKTISKKYNDKLSKLEGGEAGDEDEIAALELARCKELNAATAKYLVDLSSLVNSYAQRQEFISRKFYRDYAYWGPTWIPETANSFPSFESAYLKDIASILSEYKIVTKSDCSVFENLSTKNGKLQEWEDEFCSNFKGKVSIDVVKLTFNCNSIGIEGGEGLIGDLELSFHNDGSFNEFTIGAGIGANFNLGEVGIAEIEAGVSVKDFIKLGPDRNGNWGVKDVGVKAEGTIAVKAGGNEIEVKVIETTMAVNAGVSASGVIVSALDLK